MDQTEPRPVTRHPASPETEDLLVVEEPLEIRVEGEALAVTMRTPGHDLELVAGFLFTEGIIDGADDLVALTHVGDSGNVVDCRLAGGVAAHREQVSRATRELYATSSCGICGKASIDRLEILAGPVTGSFPDDPALLLSLPARLAEAQAAFAKTGGLHAAALVRPDGSFEVVREDIGRHNAVDKVLGYRLRADAVPVDDRLLFVSSRAGFEIVQKALVAGVPAVASVGAASTLAVDLAERSNMALYGFVRDGRFNRYA
ncbi:MAG: formate dehydrogenase accessory sulfurtransferase FdhD [Deltaproteobacteria bacterium]|nr:MAG: formate dehydrogenase accessory sulfurtransferase FdhD [Deltaproteobacteria bacterium]